MDDFELDNLTGIPQARERAEEDVLNLLRGRDAQAFTLSVICREGKWTVHVNDLAVAGGPGVGEGGSFGEAWHRINPSWAVGLNDNAGDR